MKLYTKCSHCENEVEFREKAGTRIELLKKVDENFELTCDYCGQKFERHVDQVYAKRSNFLRLLAILTLLIGTPILLIGLNPIIETSYKAVYVFGTFVTVPGVIYGLVVSQDSKRVSDFNRNKVRGRLSNIG